MAATEWSERTRMIVTVSVVAAVNLAMAGGFYYLYDDWTKLDHVHKEKVKEKKGLEEFVKQEEPKRIELKTKTERFKIQEAKLPTTDEVPQFSVDITKLGQSAKCVNKFFRMKGSAGGDGGQAYARATWGTQWEGDFMGFCKFMNQLEEHYPRFIAFENLQITPKNAGVVTMGNTHDVVVDVVTYKYVPVGN